MSSRCPLLRRAALAFVVCLLVACHTDAPASDPDLPEPGEVSPRRVQ